MDWSRYASPAGHYDGCIDAGGSPRPGCAPLLEALNTLGLEGLGRLQRTAEVSLLNQGDHVHRVRRRARH